MRNTSLVVSKKINRCSLVLTTVLGLSLAGCSVVPELEAPKQVAARQVPLQNEWVIDLDGVIVYGTPPANTVNRAETGGSGDSGGWGGGGDGSMRGGSTGGTSTPTTAQYGLAIAQIIPVTPELGNYGATLRVMDNRYQVIEAQVEIDTNAKDLKKVVVSLGGVVWMTKLVQNGDGTLDGYNAATDTYSFHVSVTKVYGDAFANTRTLYGEISPSRGRGRIYFPE